MASTYAHYKFAHLVLDRLSEPAKGVIERHIQLYDIGAHGPDILFYYQPLNTKGISKIGYDLHKKPAKEFFGKAKKIIKKYRQSERHRAYIYGFITHFVLDTAVHSYIARCTEKMSARHIEIEVEYDRFLLTRDKRNPLRTKVTKHLCPTDENARVIAKHWGILSPKKIRRAIASMKRYCDFFVTESKVKRGAVTSAFKLIGKYNELKGLFVNFTPNPECRTPCRELDRRFSEAVDIAVRTIEDFDRGLLSEEALTGIFERTFDDNGCDLQA